MSVFISDKDTAKLYIQFFLDQNNPKSKYWCKNELIYIKDFKAVQKTLLEFLNLIIHTRSFFKQYQKV